ncbi:MAG: malate synthase A [Firmicutes bacterium]|nr:malate synthase A [Bacillota bacterium]
MAVEVIGPKLHEAKQLLTDDVLEFLEGLHREFEPRRRQLMEGRTQLQRRLLQGWRPDFRRDTRKIREGHWLVGDIPDNIQDRRVEIVGPPARKTIITALNSGAQVFTADFGDANSPTWRDLIHGQLNLIDAVEGTIHYVSRSGQFFQLEEQGAALMVRPRGWHLTEPHLKIEGDPLAASFLDFGLYLFHNAQRLRARHSAPYFSLPQLESMEEAQLWEDVLQWTERHLGLPAGAIKVTVVVETLMAAFQMDEILWALRPHIVGLNAECKGYLISTLKHFRKAPNILNADCAQIATTAPFMRAYTELLVQTCHRRGAYAIGATTAWIPARRDSEMNEVALASIRKDKEREAREGFDGTGVAHPDLVPVAIEVFDRALAGRKHQRHRVRDDVCVTADHLLDFHVPKDIVTEFHLRNDMEVAIQYLASWLKEFGSVGQYTLAAGIVRADMARTEVWQPARQPVGREHGRLVTPVLVQESHCNGLDEWTMNWPHVDEAAAWVQSVALNPDLSTS